MTSLSHYNTDLNLLCVECGEIGLIDDEYLNSTDHYCPPCRKGQASHNDNEYKKRYLGNFTKHAVEYAKNVNIDLIDGRKLSDLIKKL